MYTIIPKSNTMVCCFDSGKLSRTLKKVWHALTFLDSSTDGGMRRRRIKSTELEKISGVILKDNNGGEIQAGWLSTIQGVVADDPLKIRGDRVDSLILDEFGSWPHSTKAFIQALALTEVQGVTIATILAGGTGGDSGNNLEGLREIYYNPEAFKVLPYKHKYTLTGEEAITGFFIPYFLLLMVPGYIDSRGFCNESKAKEYLQTKRDRFNGTPKSYLIYCAEYCWTAEEAFNLEGDNKFNKVKISDLLANIRLHKIGPRPVKGVIDYTFKNSVHNKENINGFRWIPSDSGTVEILEHPVWSPEYASQILKLKKEDELNEVLIDPDRYLTYLKMIDLYVAGVDGIDIGQRDTSESTKNASSFCMVIKKRAFGLHEPLIVAVYKDRPDNIRTAYKTAMMLAQYYNCRINIEATRVGFVTWARENGFLSYFMKRPRATLTDILKGVSKQYGTPATGRIIDLQTDLIADFVDDYCHTIWFEDILDLLNRYTDENKGKFDIVAAMGMVELADQELSSRTPVLAEDDSYKEFLDIGYYTDEHGYKRYGVIPKQLPINTIVSNNWFGDNNIRRTSDPRYR